MKINVENKNSKLAAIGIAAALSASVLTMPFTDKSYAAVAVFDEENIAQAIKTAINTASILSQEEKQLALAIINSRSLNANMIQRYIDQKRKASNELNEVFNEKVGVNESILSDKTSLHDYWDIGIGDIDSIMDGDLTLTDLYYRHEKNRMAAETMNKATVNTSKKVLDINEEISESLDTALENSANAEGQKEAMQANTQATAAAASAAMASNTILATMAAQQAHQAAIENAEKAAEVQRELSSRKKVSDSVRQIWANTPKLGR